MSVVEAVANSLKYPSEVIRSLSGMSIKVGTIQRKNMQFRAARSIHFVVREALTLSQKCLLAAPTVMIQGKKLTLEGTKKAPLVLIASQRLTLACKEIYMTHVNLIYGQNTVVQIAEGSCKKMSNVNFIQLEI